MSTEVYKLEIGCSRPGTNRLWRFYWQLSNTSGRSDAEIAGDLAVNLSVEDGWMSQHDFFWTRDDQLDVMRIRRVWPATSIWHDFFWRFRHRRGFLTRRSGADQARARVVWFTDRWELPLSWTNFSTYGAFGVENGVVVGTLKAQLEYLAQFWPEVRTTAFGDEFRLALMDRYGNYLPVIHGWADPRVYVTNRHHWKG